MKFFFGITFLAFLIIISALTAFMIISKDNNDIISLKIKNKNILAEIANSSASRTKGLMFRQSIGDDEGMLFIFPQEDKHSFWMVNTKIPLDIIWLNSNMEVIYIKENALPCTEINVLNCPTYTPDKPAKYVLEVNSGWTKRNNITIGDKVLK